MAEQLLDNPQVRATMQEVACERMTQNMGTDGRHRETGRAGCSLQLPSEDLTGQVPGCAVGREQPGPG